MEKLILIEYDHQKPIPIQCNKSNNLIYYNENYDITIISMENYKNILNKVIFMEIDEDIFNDDDYLVKHFNNKKAYILEYPGSKDNFKTEKNNQYTEKKNIEEFTEDKDYAIEEGNIFIEKNTPYLIFHHIQTSPGASGGPILSHNKSKVIGYHKGKIIDYENSKGIGYFLKLPIELFIKNFKDFR